MSDAPTLRTLIVQRIGVVFSISILLFTLIVGIVVNRQVHEQTDAMLLQLAHTEADGVLSEYEHGVHVHDTSLRLPSLNSPNVEKFSIAYTLDQKVLASTTNLEVDEVPESWTRGSEEVGVSRIFDDQRIVNAPLRIAAVTVLTPDDQKLIFATAVPHELIDDAVRGTILWIAFLAALMLAAVFVASILVSRKITQDLQDLSRACVEMRESPERLEFWLEAFDDSGHSTAEIAMLASTLRDLVSRLQRLIDVQNRLVAEAAHELRTPLTALQGELEIALRRDRDADAYREFIENARIDAARLADLAERLLEAARSRVEELQPERLALNTALQEAVGRHARALHDAGIEVEIDTDDSIVCADTLATARVFDNLISNVTRHSGASKLKLTSRDGTVFIEDDGQGLPESVRDNLFIPFTRRQNESHGLGLFIAGRLMRKQNGSLELEESQGTRWRCEFECL